MASPIGPPEDVGGAITSIFASFAKGGEAGAVTLPELEDWPVLLLLLGLCNRALHDAKKLSLKIEELKRNGYESRRLTRRELPSVSYAARMAGRPLWSGFPRGDR